MKVLAAATMLLCGVCAPLALGKPAEALAHWDKASQAGSGPDVTEMRCHVADALADRGQDLVDHLRLHREHDDVGPAPRGAIGGREAVIDAMGGADEPARGDGAGGSVFRRTPREEAAAGESG